MSNSIIEKCPSCGERMVVTTVSCKHCGIVISGEFDIPDASVRSEGQNGSGGTDLSLLLTPDELNSLKMFVKFEGNISKIQEELGVGYYAVKNKLKELNVKLGNTEEKEMVQYKDNVSGDGKGPASKKIISLLSKLGGSAACSMLRGNPMKIWLTDDGVANSGYPGLICEWAVFDAIVEKAKELGGKMYRGDSAAQNGAKIGSPELPLDTIDSFISIEFYGNQIGKTTLRRSTYYSAILAWAGICTNNRSDGIGGYIRLLPDWMD